MPLPPVLAGPIVRRVAGDEVAVWLALREPATVALTVWAGPQRSTGPGTVESGTPSVATGSTQTKRFGAQLHVSVVVVGGQGLQALGLLRDEAASQEATDDQRPLRLALGDELDRLPSFVTGPAVAVR